MHTSLEARLHACPTLPTLPAVALEVLRLCQDDDVDMGRLEAALGRDPAIASKLLRLANSVTVAARNRVSTVSRAVALVGTNATLSIALSFTLVRGRRRSAAAGFDHSAFWRRALFSALAGRALGELASIDREEAFLAGLLQDLGMLALAEIAPLDYGSIVVASGGDHGRLAALERAAFGGDHAAASHLLATRWNLPPSLCQAVLGSHAVSGNGDPRGRKLAETTYLSGRIADVWISTAPEEAARGALEAAESQLGLGPEVVGSVLRHMVTAVPEAAADFDLTLADEARAQAVTDAARALLRARSGVAPAVASLAGETPVVAGDRIAVELALALDLARSRAQPLSAVLAVGPADPDLLQALAPCVRQTDRIGRIPRGVLAILFETPLAGARVVAERMATRIREAGRWTGTRVEAVDALAEGFVEVVGGVGAPAAGPGGAGGGPGSRGGSGRVASR